MIEVSRGGRDAQTLRLVAALVCPPLAAAANAIVCSNVWYGIALAYAPVVVGWLGLIGRPVFDAATESSAPRYELSGKGAILGAVSAFLAVLAFAPARADRSALIAIFFASALVYYAVGKGGCLFIGCCRAVEGHVLRVPLPAIEVAWALGLSAVAAVAALAPHAARIDLLPFIAAGLLVLRLYSRVSRGTHVRASILKLDSLFLTVLIVFVIAVIFFK